MEQHTNEARMCGNIDLRNKEMEISNPNPGLVLSGSEDSGTSTLGKGTKKEFDDLPPLLANCDVDESDDNYEIAMTTPRKEGRDDIPFNEGQNTPTEGVNSKVRWNEFYNRINYSPPKATKNQDFGEAMKTVNTLIKLSNDEQLKDKTFDDLEDDQKAVLFYEVAIGMHTVFDYPNGECLPRAAKALKRTWVRTTDEHKRILSFVRRDGDVVEEGTYNSLAENMDYGHYFVDHSIGKTEGPINIFDQNDIETIFYIQHENSFMCAIIASMLSMVYSAKDFDHSKARANLSRFIRNEISARKIANLVVTDIKGVPLSEVFSSLVKCFGAPGCHKIQQLYMSEEDEALNYRILRDILSKGRAIAFTIEVFPALVDTSKEAYLDDISTYYKNTKIPRPDKANRSFHALVIVGIRPRVGTIGPMLLVQDSCKTRPFYELSLSLLMSMGNEELDFFTVRHNWKLRENCEYLMTHESRASFVGSPMQCTSSGEVVVVQQNQEPLRDMSEYFTHVEDPDNRYTYTV